jgi:hypothetical protein
MAQPLFFTCPATNQRVPTGIQTDAKSLQASWTSALNVNCPWCGKVHNVAVREAYMDSALSGTYDLLSK